ncbi:MAG: hypothetical protein HY660_06475 [Armatimonadetes bacterium]|nr:hypothetical protein [Armatimonadota bacterium]
MTTMCFVAAGDSGITRRANRWQGVAYERLLQVIRSGDARFTNRAVPSACGWSGTGMGMGWCSGEEHLGRIAIDRETI